MTVALDGNAIAGLLHDIFGSEMTTTSGACAQCRAELVVAECEVYIDAPGTVVRCRACGGIVLVVVRGRDVMCVDLRGLDARVPAVL